MTLQQKIKEIIGKLYEEKDFLIPNDGDIRKVELTYKDWLWIENFLTKSLQEIAHFTANNLQKIRKEEKDA